MATTRDQLQIAKDLALPIGTVTQTIAILGVRGSGKTNTGVVLAEQLLTAKQQVLILDPVDVWWGLKSSKDGKRPGFAIPVVGGEHADVPLDAAGGTVLADFAVDNRASIILALRHLSMNDQRKFATDFAKRLYERKGVAEHRSPLMLIVDEADEFVPQRLPHGHEAMFGAFDRLVRRGRSSGIGVTLISQRAQVINKDVLSQMETLIAMRMLHKLDREALKAWIEAHDTEGRQEEFMASLASLGRGDAWVWSPEWLGVFQRTHIRERQTFDSSATPKAGEHVAPPKEIAPVDLERLKERMAATIERAKADDPRELRKRIAELERAAKQKVGPPVKADPAAAKTASREALQKAREEGANSVRKVLARELTKYEASVMKKIKQTQGMAEQVASDLIATRFDPMPSLEGIIEEVVSMPAEPAPAAPSFPPARTRPMPPARTPAPRKNGADAGDAGALSGAAQRILDALAELEVLGVRDAPRVQVAFMAGYTNLTSKGFTNAIGSLRTAGHIDYPGPGTMTLTETGLSLANASAAPRTSKELQDRLVNMLGGANGRIVRELVSVHPNSLPREVLAERAGYSNLTSKGFTNAIGRLRTLGFIDYPQPGQIKAQDLLFLENRRGVSS